MTEVKIVGKLKSVKRLISDKGYRMYALSFKGFYKNVDDAKYLKHVYKSKMGKELNLENPTTFNEKLQWLKIYDRKPEYTLMVDKYEAKKYVAERIGEEHIIENYGVWDKFDDIDFDALPEKFVLKCTHDSGGLAICRDKNTFDKQKAKKKINRSLKLNYFYSSREWPYKNVKPRIIAEKYMEDSNDCLGLMDYKFYCFDGEPKFLYISKDLENHSIASISFLNLDWTFAKYKRSDYKAFSELPQKPKLLDEMLQICRVLSKDIPFLRVDLYEIDERVYFSELTFCPCAGFMPFVDPSHDKELGELINLK